MPMIEIKNVSKWYGDFQVLRNCSTSVEKGEVVVICGPSGSGKSTLIKTVNALEPFQSGSIFVNGVDVGAPSVDLPKLRSHVGMVFQHFELFPHLTICDNLTLAQMKVLKRTRDEAIERGLKEVAVESVTALLKEKEALDVINEEIIPALDHVGKGFEKGTVFLPQLLMSAEAAKAAFEVIKNAMAGSGETQEKKGTIILATVKGDIHDIGKNIVKVLLENYSYDVIDLGKDVPPETVVEEAVSRHVPLVGLSALMTTTVPSMEETIKQLRESAPWVKVMVGGAVLTQEYADTIGADAYCKDAMASVHYAETVI